MQIFGGKEKKKKNLQWYFCNVYMTDGWWGLLVVLQTSTMKL